MRVKKQFLIAILCVITLLSTVSGVFLSVKEAKASTLTEIELYNATNTFDVDYTQFDENGKFIYSENDSKINNQYDYSIKYSMENRNNNEVTTDMPPQITVLTHGLGSDAGTWSNHYSKGSPDNTVFAYDSESLISQIEEKNNGNVNIYLARAERRDVSNENGKKKIYSGMSLFDITNCKSATNSYYSTGTLVSSITDISKHIVVVFETFGSDESNDNVYYQFNYVISRIVYDVKILNEGKLPKLNLIGHSRGGLTNMQYALDHPDLVASLVSIGTPYFGSTTANIFGEAVMGKNDGLADIVNPEVYCTYSNRWNENYDTLYKNINAYAYGSYHTIKSLGEALSNDYSGMLSDENKPWVVAAVHAVGVGKIVTSLGKPGVLALRDMLLAPLNSVFPESKTIDILEILNVELSLDIHPLFVSWYNDVLVPLDSQQGKNLGMLEYGGYTYKGFNRITRPFVGGDANYEKVSQNAPPVAHNLEARDSVIINSIVSTLQFGLNADFGFTTKEKADGTVAVTGFNGAYTANTLEIPTSIDGKAVTEVSQFAFLTMNKDGITKIKVPSSVKGIGTHAFEGFSKVVTVELSEGVETLDVGAFTSLDLLTSVSLPNSLKNYNSGAFLNCAKLTNITVNSQNTEYTSENGVLYTKNKDKLVCYPSGKTATSFTVDAACLELSNYAFTNNSTLQTLNLNNVNTINSYAVVNCSALATLNAPKTDFIYSAGVAATKLTDEAEDIVIGKVLYKKTSAGETVVVGDNIESISAYAFVGNDSVKKVVLGKNVESVCEYAFTGCSTLENIEALNLDKVVHLGTGALDGCSENVGIKVPSNNLGDYKTDEAKGWTEYADKITTKQVSVKYYVDGSLKETKTLSYGDTLGTVDNPQKAGCLFKGWRDENGKAYDSLSVVDNADGLELFAEFEAVTYTITFQTGCDVFVQNMMFTVEEDKTLPTITREGYTFKGWNTSSDFSEANNIGTIIRKGSITNNVTLYAEWQANEYTITFVDSSGQNVENMTVTYGQPYTLPVLTKENYTFNGWRTEAGIYYSQINGASCFAVWNIAADTTLYASWTRITFKIKIDMDGRVYWVGGRDTISDTETDIEAGELGTVDDLNERFNPRKISYKEGHRFKYFAKKGFEDKLLSWSELYGNTPVDGAIYEITAIFEKEFFQLIIDGVVSSEGVNPIEGYYDDTIVYSDRLYEAVSEIGKDFDYWAISRYPINANEATKAKYPVNSKFDPETMPDLTVGIEDNGAIYLKAVMKPKTYVMTLNSEYCVSSTTMTVKYGETVKLPVYVKEGAIFNGWKIGDTVFADSNGDMLSAWTYTENKLILADWTLIEYTITYPNADMPNNPTKFTIADLPIILQPATLRAARHNGWYYDEECVNERVQRITSPGNVTLYAKWAYQCDIYYSLNGGSYTVSPTAYNAFSGDVITLPTATKTGYHDGHWRCNGVIYEFGGSFKIPETATNTSTFTFTAYWTANTYTITFDFNGGTSTSSTTTKVTATFGKTVPNINFPVRAGYRFVAYKTTKNSGSSAYYTQSVSGFLTKRVYDIDSDITLYAHWEVCYPKLSIVGKVGTTWKIKIENVSSAMVTFDYNSKMLFEKDAKVWNVNDYDKRSVSINTGASKIVDITEN